jgi:hypothetical protein
MATQTISAAVIPSWVPGRALRVRVARALAYLHAKRALSRSGIRGREARLLARELADRVRA